MFIANGTGFMGLLEPDDPSDEEEEGEVSVVMVTGIVTLVDGEVRELELLGLLRLLRMPIFGVEIPVVMATALMLVPVEGRGLARDERSWRFLLLVRDLRFWNQ